MATGDQRIGTGGIDQLTPMQASGKKDVFKLPQSEHPMAMPGSEMPPSGGYQPTIMKEKIEGAVQEEVKSFKDAINA